MIKRVAEGEKLTLAKTGVEAQKIRALWLCYGPKYDFCRFYTAEFFTVCELNGSFVVCEIEKSDNEKAPRNDDFEELSEFLAFGGYGDIFCSENVGKRLQNLLCCNCETLFLMQFTGTAEHCEVEKEPPLSEVFDILKTGFEIDFEPWYLDMSHRVRHGVTRFRKLGGSVLAIQHDLSREALLSQIATLPEMRKKGYARRLIRAVCGELSQSKVFLLCEDNLVPFYQKIGFSVVGKKCTLFPKR